MNSPPKAIKHRETIHGLILNHAALSNPQRVFMRRQSNLHFVLWVVPGSSRNASSATLRQFQMLIWRRCQ
jgi:1,2-phenylacetyl-CoA epoxidase PaaB subunit